ncbi:FAD-dependent oxidoreductase [Nonomuraea sp. NPDC026600]|uniref:NAD(P)/FAD-dependent oxidoreductase n=1 Tax=Nonomuraea sp. NPDC026600 TaxID=3155363 RepID=UPI0033F57DBD
MNGPHASGSHVVIVGGGLASVRTAQALRDLGHRGRVSLVSEEPDEPYDRPPLSKEYLLGTRGAADIRLADPDEYARRDIELLLGRAVAGMDLRTRTLTFADGGEIGYERLVVATGARPRRLPDLPESGRVHYLRTAADSRRLAGVLTDGARVAVIGAGFIGLEVACAARLRGCRVTVVEAAAQPMAPIIGAEPAAWLRRWHSGRGLEFRCGTTVEKSEERPGGRLLWLGDGTVVEADVVVVGVGVVRDTAWLAAAGLETHHGLVCDETGRTSAADVFGAGDIVCRHTAGRCRPTGHWTAASDSAAKVAAALLGVPPPDLGEDGFFWSDQADLRLQFVGAAPPTATATVVSGDFDSGKFVVHYTEGDRLTGVFAANAPRDFLRGRLALRAIRPAIDEVRT